MGAGSSVEQSALVRAQQKRIDELKGETQARDAEIERLKSQISSFERKLAHKDGKLQE